MKAYLTFNKAYLAKTESYASKRKAISDFKSIALSLAQFGQVVTATLQCADNVKMLRLNKNKVVTL